MSPFKFILIDAIIGRGFPTMVFADKMEKAGLARWTGDQHNPEWEWDRGKLKALNLDELDEIYAFINQGVAYG